MNKELTHFCSNPLCQLHAVIVTPATVEISRTLPDQTEEKHSRFAYGGGIALCEVCNGAVQVIAETFQEELAEDVKQDAKGAQIILNPSKHQSVAGFPVIDASADFSELWTPDKTLCGSA